MTQEEKQLLIKDLSARLPYGVKMWFPSVIAPIVLDEFVLSVARRRDEEFKPYLRPMSSMTEKECIALSRLRPHETDAWKYIKTPIPLYIANIKQFDFFHRHHLDWRGLILMGLALEAPKDMYKTE